MRRKLVCALFPVFACLAPLAHADLTGSTVTLEGFYPTAGTVYATAGPATVNSTVEFAAGSLAGYSEQFEITGDQIIITTENFSGSYTPAAFNGFVFDFTGAPTITSASLDSSSTVSPVSFSFTGSEVTTNFEGVDVSSGSTTVIDIATAATPEPSSFALLGTGLATLAAAGRRFRSRAGYARAV